MLESSSENNFDLHFVICQTRFLLVAEFPGRDNSLYSKLMLWNNWFTSHEWILFLRTYIVPRGTIRPGLNQYRESYWIGLYHSEAWLQVCLHVGKVFIEKNIGIFVLFLWFYSCSLIPHAYFQCKLIKYAMVYLPECSKVALILERTS